MENKGNINSKELNIQKLVSNYLHLRVSSNGLSTEGQHLDEDSLSAFVEGNLGQKESQPIVSHLVDCSFCRHVTAELVKLDFAFIEETPQMTGKTETSSKISEVLSSILSRIFGTNDGVVFAHHETEESEEKTAQKEEEAEKENKK
jgi:hypothetical protein